MAAGASALFVVAPSLYFDGFSEQGWSEAVSIILFATIASSAMALSTQMWAKQVLQLEQQEQSLRRALDVKDDFVALVSHELRTPLTSIIGYLDLVSDSEDDMPAQAVTHLEAVSRNADRLLLLVTDLLAAHATMVTPMRADDRVRRHAAPWLSSASMTSTPGRTKAASRIERHLPPGILIQADPNRLLQIIDNLLSNALKFTPPGGHISVSVRQELTGVALTVTDTGVGMDQRSAAEGGHEVLPLPQDQGLRHSRHRPGTDHHQEHRRGTPRHVDLFQPGRRRHLGGRPSARFTSLGRHDPSLDGAESRLPPRA